MVGAVEPCLDCPDSNAAGAGGAAALAALYNWLTGDNGDAESSSEWLSRSSGPAQASEAAERLSLLVA